MHSTPLPSSNPLKSKAFYKITPTTSSNASFCAPYIAAGIGFMANPIIGAIPGFLNAIYSACRIEKPENVIDQTGLKYLALIDKRLRR